MLGKCLSISHITLYVSNARQCALNYCLQFGFKPFRYRGLESGDRCQASHAVINNDIILVFVSPLNSCDENKIINQHLVKHGDAVKDIAFNVNSIDELVKHISFSGQLMDKWLDNDQIGCVKFANLLAFGDTTHTLIERNGYPKDLFLPGWEESPLQPVIKNSIWSKLSPIDLQFIDHVAANQSIGSMINIAKWYEKTLRFHRFWSADDTIISTELSGLRTIFMTNDNETIKMPINESGMGSKKSQIQEYLEYNGGPGVQHIAFHTSDICDSVYKLKERGVEFLSTPDTYYSKLRERLKPSKVEILHDLDVIQKLNILIDFDENGYLLQIFTKPIQDRPTLFLELIERHNFDGFGAGNIKSLFEAIEAQQSLRGNL